MGIFSESTEKKLNELLEKSYDAEQGFKKAAENIESNALQKFFMSKAEERLQFRNELRQEIVANGCDITKQNGSISGFLHRAWMDTKALFSSENEETMLEEVRNGEKAALNDYNEVLEDQLLPPTTTSILKKQRDAIQRSYDKANYLEKAL